MVSCLKKLLVLLLLTVPVSLSSVKNRSSRSIGLLGQHTHCSNNSECPTWYICNSTNACQCGNENDQTIVCDEEALSSAVLDCYCVTYDKDSRSTYLGLCFYNCNSIGTPAQYMKNYRQIQKCCQSVKILTEQVYCVVIVKRAIVH